MENVSCIICGRADPAALFTKKSRSGDPFGLVRCRGCGLEYVSPRPSPEEMSRYYGMDYFATRTDRGYDDYLSEKTRSEIERVIDLNLTDLGFFGFEKSAPPRKRSLDIGCAAGYFVSYLKRRGWDSRGIDVAGGCVDFARRAGLDVIEGDYLKARFGERFCLVTMWATIEHLHRPDLFLEKIHEELEDDGLLYISTCRTGGLNFKRLFGKGWRYYNFPEHLYFFSYANIKNLLEQKGFRTVGYATYGSGFGIPESVSRRAADYAAKRFGLGDMMLVSARRR